MPNVLQLINSLHEGGTERQVVQLTRMLQESGRYRPFLVCLDAGGTLRPEAERLPLGEIVEFRLTSFCDRNAARQLRRLVRYMRQRQIAIVHTHDFYTNVFGMAAASLARIPARVASRRDILGFRSPAQNLVERCSFCLAHAVIANAEAVRHYLVGGGVPAVKIVTVAVVEGETGFLVRPGDDEGLADRIGQLLQDRDRARLMGERGRQIVRQKFSCEEQLERVESLYRRLLNGPDGMPSAPSLQ
jgi:hypothetical protein